MHFPTRPLGVQQPYCTSRERLCQAIPFLEERSEQCTNVYDAGDQVKALDAPPDGRVL